VRSATSIPRRASRIAEMSLLIRRLDVPPAALDQDSEYLADGTSVITGWGWGDAMFRRHRE
jgi:hypothetical protein